ncbi:MAG TPA: hypothetical protein PLW93_04125, partial [Candidatus Absconditabacterales bacterium]|nr:hypothetical protein [Candidatus Absconditabacterales bacterium]
MSMLTPSSLEKQYPNTGKNTVEISDAEIKGKEEKNTIVQYQLAEENAIQKSEQENKVKILKQVLWVNTEFQESINSKVYYHGTMKDLSQGFDITKSNTAPAIFLSEDEQFADRYGINRDEELFGGRTYKATIHCKNTFNFRDKEKLQELRPLIEELVLQGYTYAPSGIKIVKYPIESFNGMSNPSIAEIVNHYMRRLENGSRRMLESPPFIEYLKEKGYDSFIITETGKDNIAVFDTSLVKFHGYKEEDGKWIENIRKEYLLSEDYKNFGRLSKEEKTIYLQKQEDAYKYYLSGDIEQHTQKKVDAYEYLRTLYKNKSDKEFLDSVQKIHWARDVVSLEGALKYGKDIQYDISTEGYYNEPFSSAWGNGIGIKLSGETLMASNTDLRSDNRIGTKEEG